MASPVTDNNGGNMKKWVYAGQYPEITAGFSGMKFWENTLKRWIHTMSGKHFKKFSLFFGTRPPNLTLK